MELLGKEDFGILLKWGGDLGNREKMDRKTAVIIGAGPAGLTAAYYFLTETDIHPILIEKENFVGGISRTVEYHGNRMDIGGHRFFSKNQEIVSLWQKLLPLQGAPAYDDKKLGRSIEVQPGGADPEKEDEVLLQRCRVSRILYLKHFFDYPISLNIQTLLNLGLKNVFQIGIGYLAAMIHKIEERNLEQFMVNRFGWPLYRMFFRDYTQKVWGRQPKDIDADWGSQRIKGLSLRKALGDFFQRALGQKSAREVETSLIERFFYPKFGPGQLWEKMRTEIECMGGDVVLETKVQGISLNAEQQIEAVKVIHKDQTVQVIDAEYVLSSMPVGELFAALGETAKNSEAGSAAQELSYRDFITVGVLVDQLKIRNTTKYKTLRDMIPDCWIYVQESEVKLGRIQVFNNWSPYMVKNPEHTVWLGLEYFCNEGDSLWSMDKEKFITMAIQELVKLDIIDESDVQDTIQLKVPKAYPAYFGVYKQFGKIRAYLDKIGNLYCIGRNGQHRYNNMDHSMLSAMTAVREIKAGTFNKAVVWQVNAEKEYLEEDEER